jgi:glycosyltransferase involved in cell wall biosynthesis
MIHIAAPGNFNFGTGGVSTVVFRINSFLCKKIVYHYISARDLKNKEYGGLIHEMGGVFFVISKNKIPVLKTIIMFFSAVNFFKKEKYPICYINGSASMSMFFWGLAAKTAGISIIIGHSHSSYIDAAFPIRIIKLLLHYLCRPFLPLVITGYLTCSQKAAAWMFPKSVTAGNKAVTIYNPVDIAKYAYNIPVRNAKRLEHNIEQKLVIGHAGRFTYQKNHSFLLKVFKEIVKRRSGAVLFLIGDGPLWKKVQKEAARLGVEKNVVFFGSTPLVNEYMQMFDVFLLPSRFEGLGLVAIEAQAAGLPCVISSAVPNEVKATENCLFLSLREGPQKWAEETIGFIESFERKDCSEQIKKKGFDLRDSAAQLENVFYNALRKTGIEI